jgi:hypothetical protein
MATKMVALIGGSIAALTSVGVAGAIGEGLGEDMVGDCALRRQDYYKLDMQQLSAEE